MSDRKLFLVLTFAVIGSFCLIAAGLIFFDKGGSADIDAFGQKFSSTNVGLAVFFMAALILVYAIRNFDTNPVRNSAVPSASLYSTDATRDEISWAEFIDGVDQLVFRLTAADGFKPDVVIGICGGGVMAADLIAKRLGHIPCLAIWPSRHSGNRGSAFSGLAKDINRLDYDGIFMVNSVHRVLLVDDVVYTGGTLRDACDFIRASSVMIADGDVEMRTVALFSLSSATFQADYVIYSDPVNRKMMPSSDRLRGR